jgi:hypothetical protein
MVYQYGLRLAVRFKSGGPSLGRSPGAHKRRRPVNQDQIQIFGEIGSTQFLEQGFRSCSFFVLAQALRPAVIWVALKELSGAGGSAQRIRGLALTIDAVLDFAGERAGAFA